MDDSHRYKYGKVFVMNGGTQKFFMTGAEMLSDLDEWFAAGAEWVDLSFLFE